MLKSIEILNKAQNYSKYLKINQNYLKCSKGQKTTLKHSKCSKLVKTA